TQESALAALDHARDGASPGWALVGLVIVIAGSMLTTAYSVRLWWGLFGDKPAGDDEVAHVHHAPGVLLWAPVALFAAVSLVAGVLAGPLGRRLAVASEALDAHAHTHLAVWPGFHAPLMYSSIAIIGGLAIAVPF